MTDSIADTTYTGPIVESPHSTLERNPDETPAEWTERLIHAGTQLGVFRQCSIGFHMECSDPEGKQCRCACHPERVARRALPLPTEPGFYLDRDFEPWQLLDEDRWVLHGEERDEGEANDWAPFTRLYTLEEAGQVSVSKPITQQALRSHLKAAANFSNLIARIEEPTSPFVAIWAARASLELEWARTLAAVMQAERAVGGDA